MRLNWPQTQAIQVLKPGNVVTCPWGRGVGKSWFIRTSWFLDVAGYDGVRRSYTDPETGERRLSPPGIRIVLLMPTFKQCTDVHGAGLEAMLANEWAFLGGKLNKTRWRVEFPGGSWIQFFGAENVETARGIRCDRVDSDECDDIDPSVHEAITQPWLSEPWSLKIQLFGGTPKRGRNGLLYKMHRLAIQRKPRFYSFHATYLDAPGQVDRSFVEQTRLTTSPEVFEREWRCNFDSAEGLVYPHFYEHFHVRRPPDDVVWDEVFVCCDHGWRDPTVFLLVGVLGKGRDATCWVIDELYESDRNNIWWQNKAAEWVRWYPEANWYSDPARPDRAADFEAVGARMQETFNDVDAGVASVAERLVRFIGPDGELHSHLYVSPDCRNTIEEFGKYRHKRDRTGRVLEVIDSSQFDHAMDALRYGIFSRFHYDQPGPRREAHLDKRP